MKRRLIILAGLLAGTAGALVSIGSCDIDDYDPYAVAAETGADFIENLSFDLTIPQGVNRLVFHRSDQGQESDLAVSTPGAGGFTGMIFPRGNRLVLGAGTRLDAEAAGFWNSAADSFSITVEEDIVIEKEFPVLREYAPSQGRFVILDGDRTITVVFATVSGQSGVRLSLNGEETARYTVDAFEDLIGSSAAIWKRKASLSYFALDYLMDQIFFTTDTVNIIETHGGNLAAGGSITFLCDSLVPGSDQDPLRPEYTRTLTWTDTDGSGVPDSGDAFQWLFFACWENDLGDLVDDLVEGLVHFSGFVVEREQPDGSQAITRFGFVSDGEQPVGVLYDNLDWIQVGEEFPGTLTFDPFMSFTINGGFDVVFADAAGQEP